MRLATVFSVVLATILMAVPASAAPVFETPEALIAYAYQPYSDGNFPDDAYELFSPRLRALFEADMAAAGEEGMGGLEFDPFIDSQDYDVVKVNIDAVKRAGDKAEVQLTVTNFGEHALIDLSMVRTEKGWLIDEMARTDGAYPWRLSEILTQAPLLN